jgi:cytidine deaminase
VDQSGLREKWHNRLASIPAERLGGVTQKDALDLLGAADMARSRAYAAYSNFAVGAAILCEDGRVFTGANVENASYGAAICAERVAAFTAVSAGCRAFAAIAVVADSPRPIPPCGSCRQVVVEFTRRVPVIMANAAGEIEVRSIDELLPLSFETHHLDRR